MLIRRYRLRLVTYREAQLTRKSYGFNSPFKPPKSVHTDNECTGIWKSIEKNFTHTVIVIESSGPKNNSSPIILRCYHPNKNSRANINDTVDRLSDAPFSGLIYIRSGENIRYLVGW